MRQHDEVVNGVSYDNTEWPVGRALRRCVRGQQEMTGLHVRGKATENKRVALPGNTGEISSLASP